MLHAISASAYNFIVVQLAWNLKYWFNKFNIFVEK